MKHRNQVEITIQKNDYLTISFMGDIDFAGRWYGTAEVLRERLRSHPHNISISSEREKMLGELINHYEQVIKGGKGITYNHQIDYQWIYGGVVDYLKKLRQEAQR